MVIPSLSLSPQRKNAQSQFMVSLAFVTQDVTQHADPTYDVSQTLPYVTFISFIIKKRVVFRTNEFTRVLSQEYTANSA